MVLFVLTLLGSVTNAAFTTGTCGHSLHNWQWVCSGECESWPNFDESDEGIAKVFEGLKDHAERVRFYRYIDEAMPQDPTANDKSTAAKALVFATHRFTRPHNFDWMVRQGYRTAKNYGMYFQEYTCKSSGLMCGCEPSGVFKFYETARINDRWKDKVKKGFKEVGPAAGIIFGAGAGGAGGGGGSVMALNIGGASMNMLSSLGAFSGSSSISIPSRHETPDFNLPKINFGGFRFGGRRRVALEELEQKILQEDAEAKAVQQEGETQKEE